MSSRSLHIGIAMMMVALGPVIGVVRAEKVEAWLLVDPAMRESLISHDAQEKAQLEAQGWRVDATGCIETEAVAGSGAVHRLTRVRDDQTERVLETDAPQIPLLVQDGFSDEGAVGHVAASDSGGPAVIQYRQGEQRVWLSSQKARAAAEKAGWKKQGVHFWLWPAE